jgi:UDP-N-acetylglucosamine--N-acetylmuramyl-(pentapeptide) pyrophosphoryl-undecaprenol N-acetylglucosamine transferase
MLETVVFTGGGSGGHVFPGLAVIEELQDRFSGRIVWIGSKHGIERRIVESKGIEYRWVPSGKLRRYFDLRNLLDLFRIVAGIVASLILLVRLRPSTVFSKGGYVSVPPVVAARLLGIPVVTHDSDTDPGLATRINARFADSVLVAYPQAAGAIKHAARVEVTGNPVRRAVFDGDAERGRAILDVADEIPVLFFVGGSQGARQINGLVEELKSRLSKRFFIIHQCGAQLAPLTEERYYRRQFFDAEYPDFLAAASLVISRAGANTLWELSATGTPAVLIPLPTGSSRGDQLRNAAAYEAIGGATVLEPKTVDADILYRAIAELMDDPARRAAMAAATRRLGAESAASRIATRILDSR